MFPIHFTRAACALLLSTTVLSFVTTQKKNQRKSLRPPIPTTARPVVSKKSLPRIQTFSWPLPVGRIGLPLHPPWRTVHTPRDLMKLTKLTKLRKLVRNLHKTRASLACICYTHPLWNHSLSTTTAFRKSARNFAVF